MKPGDKVWVFYNQKIIQVNYDVILGEPMLTSKKLYPVVGILADKLPYFPTREALCEHYRNIFE